MIKNKFEIAESILENAQKRESERRNSRCWGQLHIFDLEAIDHVSLFSGIR